MAEQAPAEPMLRYVDGAWRGQDEQVVVKAIAESALLRHAQWLLMEQGIRRYEDATNEQKSVALREVKRVAYWRGRQYDREGDVHVIDRPQTGLFGMGGQPHGSGKPC